MQITRRAAMGALGLALVLGSAGCGKVADKAAEKATEKAIEGSSGCEDVDISGDGGTISCDGATYDYSGEGNASLPDGWPSEVSLPDGTSILAATSNDDPLGYHVTATVDGDLEDVFDDAEGRLTDGGFTVDGSSRPSGDVQVGSIQASGSGLEVNVALYGDGTGEVTITYTVNEVAT